MKFTFKFCAVIITGILFSCVAPQFKILPTGDKFSDSNAPYGFVGKNNRLSTKSSKGGTHICRLSRFYPSKMSGYLTYGV